MSTIQLISGKDIYELLPMSVVVDVVEEAFKDMALGEAKMPPKVYLELPEHGGDFRAMPAYSKPRKLATVKWVNSHPDNPQKGLPAVDALLIANDPDTAQPIAIMDAKSITALRTGASGGVAMKALAAQTDRWLFIGAGAQSLTQCEAMATVVQPKSIVVVDPNPSMLQSFVKSVSQWVTCPIEEADLTEDVVRNAQVIVTTTPGRGPLFAAEWVSPGTHINAIGADAEGKQELDSALVAKAKVIVDDWVQAAHSGEINVPIHNGVFSKDDHVGNLGEVLIGKLSGRTSPEDITLFDSTGLALQDLYTASEALERLKSSSLQPQTWSNE